MTNTPDDDLRPEDQPKHWKDHNNQPPGDNVVGWKWDLSSLETGEYIGYRLYQLLRDRLCETSIPHKDHDRVLLHMIDMHDVELIDNGVGCVTLVCGVGTMDDADYQRVSVVAADVVPPFESPVNWKDIMDDMNDS